MSYLRLCREEVTLLVLGCEKETMLRVWVTLEQTSQIALTLVGHHFWLLAFQQKVQRLPYPVLPLLLFIHLEQGQQYVKGVGSIPGDNVRHSLSINPTLKLLIPSTFTGAESGSEFTLDKP